MATAPTFALFTTRMEGWYQSQVWHGAGTASRMLGARIVALVGSAFGAEDQVGGPTGIFDLARLPEFDGYLLLGGGLANFRGETPLRELLEHLPPRPTVSLGLSLPGAACILHDGGGMTGLARHLIGVHGIQRMAYVGGPRTNADARRRWEDWNRVLAEHGLAQDPRLVVEGDFMPRSASTGARRILDRVGLPQAFVCANDAMALGVRKVLAERGIRIPQDVLLTGYDDIEEASTLAPPLTTVRTGSYQMAFRGVELLMDLLRGGRPRTEILETQLVTRRSCGCHSTGSTTLLPRLVLETAALPSPEKLLKLLPTAGYLEQLEDRLDRAEATELDLWEENLYLAARHAGSSRITPELLSAQTLVGQARHGLDTRRRQELHHLMRTQFQAIQALDFDADRQEIPARLLEALRPFSSSRLRLLLFRPDLQPVRESEAYRTGFALALDTSDGSISAPPPDRLLPENDAPHGTWATLSLSLGADHYGIAQLRDWNNNELFLESLRLSLTMVLSVYRKSVRESEIRQQLVALSRRDELTGLLNRRGLLEQADVLVRTAQRERRRIGVVLCDLDGLKGINDRWGHGEGDQAIICLARSLEDGFRQSDLVCRLGGDEFAVATLIDPETDLGGAIDRLRQALARRNQDLARPWQAATSVGWTNWDPNDGRTLEQVLAQADEDLYRDKRNRRESCGPVA